MRTPHLASSLASSLTALLAAGGLAACVDGGPQLGAADEAVIGGTKTPDGMFPGVGALLYNLGEGPQTGCTGTLIAPTVVLTAAHCVDPQLGGDVLVGFTLDHDTVTAPPVMKNAIGKRAHPQFDLQADIQPGLGHWYDIGLVFLAAPIEDVPPVKLPRPDDGALLAADGDIHIVGYGRISNETNDVGVMYDADTKLVSLNEWELQIAAGGGQPQNCHGDSGGPGLFDVGGATRVVGTVSRSFDLSGECLNGGVDTRVDAYLDWIFAQPEVMAAAVPCGSGLAEACEDDDDGGCSTGGGRGGAGGALALAGLALVLARRSRRR